MKLYKEISDHLKSSIKRCWVKEAERVTSSVQKSTVQYSYRLFLIRLTFVNSTNKFLFHFGTES